MARIFSLHDDTVDIEIPTEDTLQIVRRVISVETLEGTESRDVGSTPNGLVFSVATVLEDDDLASLADAVEAGVPLGISLLAKSYAVLVSGLTARRRLRGGSDVTVNMVVEQKI